MKDYTMVRNLFRVTLSEYINQRGTGQPIQREEAIVYDFMPVVLGDRFRTDEVLSRMLLRPAPEEGPFMLKSNAYETLGLKYVDREELIPALECYRIALDSRTSFATAIARIQGSALLNQREIAHMDTSTDLEQKLVREVAKSRRIYDRVAYTSWVEGLRTDQKQWRKSNKEKFGSPEYVEACLKIGEYEQALLIAKDLGDKKLMKKVKQTQPKEILDVKFLKKYIDDNHPELTI